MKIKHFPSIFGPLFKVRTTACLPENALKKWIPFIAVNSGLLRYIWKICLCSVLISTRVTNVQCLPNFNTRQTAETPIPKGLFESYREHFYHHESCLKRLNMWNHDQS